MSHVTHFLTLGRLCRSPAVSVFTLQIGQCAVPLLVIQFRINNDGSGPWKTAGEVLSQKKLRLWSEMTGRTEPRYVCGAHFLKRYISSILSDRRFFFKLCMLIIHLLYITAWKASLVEDLTANQLINNRVARGTWEFITLSSRAHYLASLTTWH
jgi:hypothetical protein